MYTYFQVFSTGITSSLNTRFLRFESKKKDSRTFAQSIAIISIYQGEKLSLITTNVYQRSIFLSFSLDELKHFSTLIAFEFSNPQSIWIIDRKLISMITNERSKENDKLRVKNRSEMTVSWTVFEFADQERVTIHNLLRYLLLKRLDNEGCFLFLK